MSPSVAPLEASDELCFHALAHVPVADPGSSYDAGYLSWAAGVGLADADRRDDGALVGRSIGVSGRGLLHHWIGLWADLDQLAAAGTRALAELRPSEVADPALLAAIQAAADPALEVFHASVALDLPAWRAVHRDTIVPAMHDAAAVVGPMLASVVERVTTLRSKDVALSWVLGPRGRGHATRLIVGAPAVWHDGTAEQSVVIVLHEHAVRDLARGDWASVEWSALRRVAGWVIAWPELQRAHQRWVARLELRGLIEVLRSRETIDDGTASSLAGPDRWQTLCEHAVD